jgi:regulator of nucleoside diphosphate kinase
MEPAMIMVLALCAGVLALLVWFEVNSRRNEASKKQASSVGQSALSALRKEDQSKAESEIKKNAA